MPASTSSQRSYGLPSHPRSASRLVKQTDDLFSRQSAVRKQVFFETPQATLQHNDIQRRAGDGNRGNIDKPISLSSSSSASSSSPSQSTFSPVDRTRRKWKGYTSSRRSIDTNDSQVGAEEGWETVPIVGRTEHKGRNPDNMQAMEPLTQDGTPLWNRVTNLANNLTINVGKAWAMGASSEDGEDTPMGAESRLTRAMKSYYLQNARDHTDLPDWLFNERERRSKAASNNATRDDGKGTGRRTYDRHYDHASTDDSAAVGNESTSHSVSSGGDRLKALREKRRNAASSGSVSRF